MKAGLHCGCGAGGDVRPGPCAVLPAVKAGLHCGAATFAMEQRVEKVLPAVKAGLHCGNRHLHAREFDAARSSRP